MTVTRLSAGACTPADSALFFGGDGESERRRRSREAKAKALCSGCPSRAACLKSAMERREPWGIWGGEVFEHGRPRPAASPVPCSAGLHLMTRENTYVRPGTTWKYCRECRRIREQPNAEERAA